MLFTRAADALLAKFLPKVDASAAITQGAKCYCTVRSTTCKSGYIYENLYWRVTDYYGQCTVWGTFCSSRRTLDRC